MGVSYNCDIWEGSSHFTSCGNFTRLNLNLGATIWVEPKPLGTIQRNNLQSPLDTKPYIPISPRLRFPLHLFASTASPNLLFCPIPEQGIHWESKHKAEAEKSEPLGERFSDIINRTTSSHYKSSTICCLWSMTKFLVLSCSTYFIVWSDFLEYQQRRTSKRSKQLTEGVMASEKFMQLREAYNALSNENSRQFYDWTLAQEAENRWAERMRMKLEDPSEQDLRNWESIPDTVDRLGRKNMKLSDQATTALTIDVAIIIFPIWLYHLCGLLPGTVPSSNFH